MITPNGVFFTIVHDGVPDIDPSVHQLLIHGLVKRPLIFSYEALLRYPMTSRIAFIECGGNSAGLFSPQPLQADVQALAWAGLLRRMDRRQALDAARRDRHRSESQMVHRRGRRCGARDAQRSARQGPR